MIADRNSFEPIARTDLSRLTPAPSLRIPVTEGNRALLRRMRANELSSWVDPSAPQEGDDSGEQHTQE
jgi:hypothetical protein